MISSVKTLVIMVFSFLCAGIAFAQDELPTSNSEPVATWQTMHQQSYPLTAEQLFSQCQRAEQVDLADWFTPEKCAILTAKFLASDYEVVSVPDGIVFDFLSGMKAGLPHIYRLFEKALGREDRALLFDLGDGVYAYWFVGDYGEALEERSCRNLAIVKTDPPPPPNDDEDEKDPPHSPQVTAAMSCPIFHFSSGSAGWHYHIPGTFVEGCDNYHSVTPGNTASWEGTVRSQGYAEICH